MAARSVSRSNDLAHLGFIGLGIMGRPMVAHLASVGYPVVAYDRDAAATAAVVAAHPEIVAASSVAEVGENAEIVVTMLPDGHAVRDVIVGDGGLAASLASGALVIDTSSSQPWLTEESAAALAAVGVQMVDAPVSGAEWGAEAAELVFMVGGEDADVRRAAPIFDVLGRATFHVGPLGSGHVMKCINNLVTAMTFQGTLEGMAIGVASGLDPEAMNAVFNESTAESWITRNHIGRRILSRTFDDPFRLSLMRKDIDIATDLAADRHLDLEMASLVRATYADADGDAGPGASLSELGRWVERAAGVVIAKKSV